MAQRSSAQKATDNTARQSAAGALETTMATLKTNIATYLAAGSGDNVHARKAVADYIQWQLATTALNGVHRQSAALAPGYPHKNLSLIDFELATD
jgi:ribosomal protein S20